MTENRETGMIERITTQRRSILTPVAYSEALMPSLQLARSSRAARRIASVLFVILVLTIFAMAFAPWQQSITGAGYVVAYAPTERQQTLEAPIKGRIARWNPSLVENARVAKGEFIAEIRDLDESYSERLKGQLDNVVAVREFTKKVVEAHEGQLRDIMRYRQEVEAAQNAYVQSAKEKVNAAQQKLSIAEAAIFQLEQARDRARDLQAKGNIALEKLQEIERKLQESEGKVKEESANLAAAQADLRGKESDREAYIHKASAEVKYYEGLLDKARGEVSKAEKDEREMESKVARQNTQEINAPFDGYVVQISSNGGSQMVKEGDPICTLVPYTQERAVQIWLDGNDAPLVEAGRHVRLQFEGWPAVQFSGWPSVAVGTFGGTVVSVDMVDNGKGKFRCQILPDPTEEQRWPSERYLRQGVRANGWVLLDQVPLWFEAWRQLNGFPPSVDIDSSIDSKKSDDASKSRDGGEDKGKTKLR
jgi:multidrug efflux pump subunit AcrA (membrane-fusion protein)